MWRETSKHERNQKIWEDELASFVPAKVLDFHVHVFSSGVVPCGQVFSCAGHPIEKYDYEDLGQDLLDLYPERETYAVCFGLPDLKYNQVLNDRYLAQHSGRRRFFPLRLFDPHHDRADAIRADLTAGGFVGIKPYLIYVRKEDPNQVEIPEMLPDWVMEIVDELALIVMLHIPRQKRLADPLNQVQIIELCRRYPRAKIVLAHIGRAYYLRNIVGYLDDLKELPNLWFDLAMLNNWEVLEYLFDTVDSHKILYGTDIPIALAPGKSVEINDQYAYVTPVPWELSISDEHGGLVFTSFLFEELRAIRKAVERLGLGEAFARDLFYNNGASLLNTLLKPEEALS